MNTKPDISVIIPCYNQAHFLPCAIVSLLKQTHENWEAIIVNDGSADTTDEVARNFNDVRIQTISQDNQGLSAARNTGIAHASAEIIAFLDADDYYFAEALEQHLSVFAAHPEAALHAGAWQIVDQHEAIIEAKRCAPAQTLETLLYGNRFHVGSVAVRAHALREAGLFDAAFRACEDWDAWLRIALAGGELVVTDRLVGHYRMHGAQMTKDAERMRTAALQTLNKVAARDDVPDSAESALKRAFALVYANAACRYYRQGDIAAAQQDIVQAIAHDGSILAADGEILVNLFRGWAEDASVPDKGIYLNTVFSNLPDEAAFLCQQKSRVLANVYAESAFENVNARQLFVGFGRMVRSLRYDFRLWVPKRFVKQAVTVFRTRI